MARWLCDRGFAVLTFDWRGCVGAPSPRAVLPDRIAEDLCAGVTYLQSRPDIEPTRIGVLGRGLGGGFAVLAAASDTRIAATVCFSGFGDFSRRTALHLGVEVWDQIRALVAADEHATVDATDHMEMYPGRNDSVYNHTMNCCEDFLRRHLFRPTTIDPT
jgi:dienelactone hydrolase